MDVLQLAERWGVHYNSIYRFLRQTKELAFTKTTEHPVQIRISLADIQDYEQRMGFPEPSDRCTLEEAMAISGLSRGQIVRRLKSGKIPTVKIVKSYVFSKKFMEGLRNESVNNPAMG